MIDYRRRGYFFLFQALHAQGVTLEVQFPGFAPLGVVSPRGSAATERVGRPFFSVFLAESALFAQIRTAGVAAGAFGCFRHGLLPFLAEDEQPSFVVNGIM